MLQAESRLKEPVCGGDYQALVQVMGYLLEIRDRQTSTDQLFEPVIDVVNLLEQYGETLPECVHMQLEVRVFDSSLRLTVKWELCKVTAFLRMSALCICFVMTFFVKLCQLRTYISI